MVKVIGLWRFFGFVFCRAAFCDETSCLENDFLLLHLFAVAKGSKQTLERRKTGKHTLRAVILAVGLLEKGGAKLQASLGASWPSQVSKRCNERINTTHLGSLVRWA